METLFFMWEVFYGRKPLFAFSFEIVGFKCFKFLTILKEKK